MKFICACSGISAPTVALKPLGWTPIAYAEIDPAAAAILAARHGAGRPEHMPDPEEPDLEEKVRRERRADIRALDGVEWGSAVPNVGDFRFIRDKPWIGEADAIIAGTPCQGFSFAGLRGGLSDARGNLTMEFIRLANAVDDLRRADGKPPAWVWWENVPGVFSLDDNAFGAFLGGLVGAGRPLLPSGRGKWTDSGVVAGPQRVAAWRVLDAMHFGLAQRRRRVFVLARGYPGAWAVADALLPIIDSLRGDSPPRRKAGEGVARSLTASTGGPSAKEQQYTFVQGARPLNALDEGPDGAPGGAEGSGGRIPGGAGGGVGAADLDREAVAFSLRGRAGEPQAEAEPEGIAPALRTGSGGASKPMVAVAFKPLHFTRGKDGAPSELSPALTADADKGDQDPILQHDSAVRRLTPVECERLQGFPDNFTLIDFGASRRGPEELEEAYQYLLSHGFSDNEARALADSPDSHRYRTLGNSMPGPVLRHIALQIMRVSGA